MFDFYYRKRFSLAMNIHLEFENGNPLHFIDGTPEGVTDYLLPFADCFYSKGPFGLVCVQEIRSTDYLLRHFVFVLQSTLSFQNKEANEGLQTLFNVRGELQYQLGGLKEVKLKEKEFAFLHAGDQATKAIITGGKLCSFINTYYAPGAYEGLFSLFPSLKKQLEKIKRKAYLFVHPPKPAHYSIYDTIRALWLDRYTDVLKKKHMELLLQTALFNMLAETYARSSNEPVSSHEREKADAAREILLRNVKIHLMPEDIAYELHCSVPWLKKAFSKVYGEGMFHFLRRTRMERAHEMLIKGESLKVVSIEVGMKPSNFPKEFKSFFGYTVTELKKGLL
jgi:AraC-like DNA-binding protein